MAIALYYERRKANVSNVSMDFVDRRVIERRKDNSGHGVLTERRRLVFNVRCYERDSLKIPLCIKRQDKEIAGYTKNINPAGLMIVCSTAMQISSPVGLQFSFGDSFCYMNVLGEVVFCRALENGESGQYGIGIKFSKLHEWERKVLISATQAIKENPSLLEKSLLSISVSRDTLELETARTPVIVPHIEKPWSVRQQSVHASKVVGWGSYLPGDEITSDDISERLIKSGYKNVGEVIESMTGLKSRRYENKQIYPSDLAAEASLKALKNAGMDAKDLDVIIFFGISKDLDEPAVANLVQEKIGAKHAYAFDLANACNGFVTALDVLDSMIKSGRCENGLVATGELISPYIDWEPKTKDDFKLSIFGYTLGDAGGAAVSTRAADNDRRRIHASWFANDGTQWRLAIAGRLEGANPNNKYFKSRGRDIEGAGLKYVPIGFQEILDILDWTVEDVDVVIPHQIPVSILENLYHKKLGIPYEKLIWTFPKYGNNATASMPVAVTHAIEEGRLKPGDKTLLVGGAAGFSVGIIGMTM